MCRELHELMWVKAWRWLPQCTAGKCVGGAHRLAGVAGERVGGARRLVEVHAKAWMVHTG